ncbi:GAF domain-containing protein [Paracoccus suum]|nr:GAF domain-containing protein [Paracoccus suum]
MPDSAPMVAVGQDVPDESMAGDDSCAREPIQFLGGVQDFGCLLVLSTDWVVRNASANCGAVLGIEAEAMVGTRLIEHLPPDAMHLLRGKVQILGRGGDDGISVFEVDLLQDGRRFDIALHRDGDNLLFDFERSGDGTHHADAAVVGALLARVRAAPDPRAMCDIAANGIWAMTGFDRVMVYKFDPDYSGVVIAEALGAGADSYMDQRFPASDIPAQARALYTRSLLRIIADVDAPVHPLVPAVGPDGKPVDLSLSVTRAVAPIHLTYLRNMGVGASMSASILRGGKLWGMIACHHPRAHYVDYNTRAQIELFTRLLSYELTLAEIAAEGEHARAAHAMHERVSAALASGIQPGLELSILAQEIGTVIAFDGMTLMLRGIYDSQGLTPTEAEHRALLSALVAAGPAKVFATDHLEADLPGVIAPERGIGGLLAIPLRSHPREYVLLLRREVTQDVVWAGVPQKTLLPDGRLSPRKSFEAWREQVSGHSLPWNAGDLRAAEVLRITLLEMALKQTADTSHRDLRRSHSQEVVIAELNHRLRNMFGLVGGLISRGAAGASPEVGKFATELRGRIEALARASDVLTGTSEDQDTTLRRLICTEIEAFAGDSERLHFSGGDVVLAAGARGTMALVIHELVTNAVKYGALSSPSGQVEVAFVTDGEAGDERPLRLRWTERGGPAVRPPKRSGFGSTLLSSAIPHELGGDAQVSFEATGLAAEFLIPARCIEEVVEQPEVQAASARTAAARGARPRFTGRALVVEDNLLIAMNAADALRAMGAADVVIAGTIADALERIAAGGFDLAILDLDLGGRLSTPVAEALRAAGVPFLLATGYDDGSGAAAAVLRDAPRLSKPYSNDAIAEALRLIG